MVATPSDATMPAGGGWRRWMGPALFASVCVNLFLVGLMIGGVVPLRHHPVLAHWFGRGPGPMANHVAIDPPPPPPLRAGGPGQAGQPAGPGAGPGGGPGGSQALAFRQAIQALPDADRRVFDETMEGARAEVRRGQSELRQARQRVNESIRAEPFDKQAMLSALADVRQRQDAIQLRLHIDTAEAVSKLSPDTRRQFADSLSPRPRP